jgi:hypothetical protein
MLLSFLTAAHPTDCDAHVLLGVAPQDPQRL